MEQFAGDIDPLLKRRNQLINTFMNGAEKGFKTYFDDFGTHLKCAVAKWLDLSVDLLNLESFTSWKSATSTALNLVGLTWEHLVGLVVDTIGADNFAFLVGVFTKISDATSDVSGWVQTTILSAEEDLANIISAFGELANDMVNKGIIPLGKDVAESVGKKIVALLVPGAGLIEAIYDAVKWFFANKGKLKDVWDLAKQVYQKAVDGLTIGAVSDFTIRALDTLLEAAVTIFASFVGITGVPEHIKELLQKLTKSLESPIRAFLNLLKAALDKILCPILDKLGLQGKALLKPDSFQDKQGETHHVWIDVSGREPEVMMGSTPKSVRKQLKDWLRCAPDDATCKQIEDALKLTSKLRAGAKDIKDLLPSAKQNASKNTATKIATKGKDTGSDQQKLTDALGKLAVKFPVDNRGLTFVKETPPTGDAGNYEAKAPGYESGKVPALCYDNPGGRNRVKFDGYSGKVLYDRKLSFYSSAKGIDQLRRQSAALQQNSGYSLIIQVPTPSEKKRIDGFLTGIGTSKITVEVCAR